MKIAPCFLFAMFFIVVLDSSCRKTGTSPGIYILWDLDTLMMEGGTTNTKVVYRPPYINASGAMIVCETMGTLTDTGAQTINYFRRWGAAHFGGGDPGAGGANAGAVSLNSVGLPFIALFPHQYKRHDTMMAWNERGINHWSVAGSTSVPAISADIEGTLPSFTGGLPTAISKSSDFSLTFNASNTANGDMAYVVIYSLGKRYQSNVVSASGGTATISTADLMNATNEYLPLSGRPVGKLSMPVYYGGFIAVIVYKNTMQTFGGRQFAFVKQKVVMGNVTFF